MNSHKANFFPKQSRNSLVPLNQNRSASYNKNLLTGAIRSVGNLTPINNLQQSLDNPQSFQRKTSHLIENNKMKVLPIIAPQGIYSLQTKPVQTHNRHVKQLRQSLQVSDGTPCSRSRQSPNGTSFIASYAKTGKSNSRRINMNLIQKGQLPTTFQQRSMTVMQSPLPLTPSGHMISFISSAISPKKLVSDQTALLNQDTKLSIHQRQPAKRERPKLESFQNLANYSLAGRDVDMSTQIMGVVGTKRKVDRTLPIEQSIRSPYENNSKQKSPAKKIIPPSQFSRNKSQLESFSALAASSKQSLLRPQALIQLRSQQVLDTWTPQSQVIVKSFRSDLNMSKEQPSLELPKGQRINQSSLNLDRQTSLKKMKAKEISFALQKPDQANEQITLLHQPKIIFANAEKVSLQKVGISGKDQYGKEENKIGLTEEQIDQSMFSFTFNKDSEQQQPLLESASKQKTSQERGSSAQGSFKTPTQLKVTNVVEDFKNDFELLDQRNCQPRIRPISQVRDRNQHLLNYLSSNNSEYSNKNQSSGNGNRQVLRPTSGMNSYLKGKLPDCFLLDSQPLLRKNPASIKSFTDQVQSPQNDSQNRAAAQAYLSYSGKSTSVHQGAGSDTNIKTRVHSAQTYINYPTGAGSNQLAQTVEDPRNDKFQIDSGLCSKPSIVPSIPIKVNPRDEDLTATTVQFKKPLIRRKLLGQIFTKNTEFEVSKRNLYAQSSRASISNQKFQ